MGKWVGEYSFRLGVVGWGMGGLRRLFFSALLKLLVALLEKKGVGQGGVCERGGGGVG
jgi:pyruvate/2-oxoglutarate dehydrogenase complex dihydrolipoamide dehydrogenase (E3) component